MNRQPQVLWNALFAASNLAFPRIDIQSIQFQVKNICFPVIPMIFPACFPSVFGFELHFSKGFSRFPPNFLALFMPFSLKNTGVELPRPTTKRTNKVPDVRGDLFAGWLGWSTWRGLGRGPWKLGLFSMGVSQNGWFRVENPIDMGCWIINKKWGWTPIISFWWDEHPFSIIYQLFWGPQVPGFWSIAIWAWTHGSMGQHFTVGTTILLEPLWTR